MQKKKTAILILALIFALALAVSGVYAVLLNFSILDGYRIRTGTDAFSISGQTAYYAEYDSVPTSVTVIREDGGSDKDTYAIDLIIITDGSVVLNGGALSHVAKKTVSYGSAYVFMNIEYGTDKTALTLNTNFTNATKARIVAIPHGFNYFVSDLFELRMTGDAELFNSSAVENEYAQDVELGYKAYRNVYLLDDIAVTSQTEIIAPLFLNLLWYNLNLADNITITNNYRGMYAIETISGNIVSQNESAAAVINAPNAYYQVDTKITGIQVAENVDFAEAGNETLLAAMLNDAKNYALDSIPEFVLKPFEFPMTFHSYDVDISYSFKDAEDNPVEFSYTREENNREYTVMVTVAYPNGSEVVAEKKVTIVGTSSAAINAALTGRLSTAISIASTNILEKERLLMPVNIGRVISDFAQDAQLTGEYNLSLSGDKSSYLYFTDGVTKSYSIDMVFDNGTVSMPEPIEETKLRLEYELFVFDDVEETFTITDNSDSTVTNSILISPTYEDTAARDKYLNRYVDDIYFAELGGEISPADALQIAQNMILLGPAATAPVVVRSTIGFEKVTYRFYRTATTAFNSLVSNDLTIAELLNLSTEFNDFTVSDGQIRLNQGSYIDAEAGEALFYTVEFDKNEETVTQVTPFVSYGRIIVPVGGIGGNEFTQFQNGETFAYYFENLTDGMLIDSTADTYDNSGNILVDGTAFEFRTGVERVILEMSIMTSDIENFCTLVSQPPDLQPAEYWQINIDHDYLPAHNTVVTLKCVFRLRDAADDGLISEQYYSFIIPGVYRTGENGHFLDERLYRYIIGYTSQGEHVYESAMNGEYLLVNGARASSSILDVTGIADFVENQMPTAMPVNATYPLDITGLHYLTGTTAYDFSGVPLKNLDDFSNFNGATVTSLKLSNCGVTDSMLYSANGTTTHAPLYALNSLSVLWLDGNSISSFVSADSTALFYRTVAELRMGGQRTNNGTTAIRCLDDIDGIDLYPEITELWIENNAIADFNPLLDLDKLAKVYLFGNVATEFTGKSAEHNAITFYGTDGEINKPIYVELYLKGINIYDVDAVMIKQFDENSEMFIGSLLLNATSFTYTQKGGISLPSKANYPNGTAIDITPRYVIQNNVAANFTVTPSSSGLYGNTNIVSSDSLTAGEVDVIFSVTINSVTVYRLITVTLVD